MKSLYVSTMYYQMNFKYALLLLENTGSESTF